MDQLKSASEASRRYGNLLMIKFSNKFTYTKCVTLEIKKHL